jgi:hypothetical protein
MILSASRRTDIPALYADWFFDRLKDGYFLVPSPFIAQKKIAKVKVEPVKIETNILGGKTVSGNIDGIVFWTKNPKPMLTRLGELKDYMYCFLFTLNAYDKSIESDLPPFDERIKSFQDLSRMIGADRVIWRYDPILLSKSISVDWHLTQFENLAKQLNGFTKICKISFLIGKHNDICTPNYDEKIKLVQNIARIAKENNIQVEACAEYLDFAKYGIKPSKCIDPDLFSKLLNAKPKSFKKDSGQRKNCGCMPCVDIGIYNTCKNGCIYCYANGFYAYRGEPKSMYDKQDGEIYERKIESSFHWE